MGYDFFCCALNVFNPYMGDPLSMRLRHVLNLLDDRCVLALHQLTRVTLQFQTEVRFFLVVSYLFPQKAMFLMLLVH